MIILTINPNTGKYFKDVYHSEIPPSKIYHGIYKQIPIYPFYCVTATYKDDTQTLKFSSMVEVERGFNTYLVQVNLDYKMSTFRDNPFNVVLETFHKNCNDIKENLIPENLLK